MYSKKENGQLFSRFSSAGGNPATRTAKSVKGRIGWCVLGLGGMAKKIQTVSLYIKFFFLSKRIHSLTLERTPANGTAAHTLATARLVSVLAR